jgi:putative SOS response-associated peptidase YedK
MLKSGDLFAFAGLWDLWEKEGNAILSCSIITTTPNKLCANIHERMPVILPKESESIWLSDTPVENVLGLLKPYSSVEMQSCEISTKINNPENNSPEVLLK